MNLARWMSVLIVFIVSVSSMSVSAADGDLDPTFGVFGKLTLDISGATDEIRDVVVLNDGSIVVAGNLQGGWGSNIVVAKFHSNGSLADEFGTGGIVITDLGGWEEAAAIHVLPDNHLLVAGSAESSDYDFVLLKYNADGSLDTNFGSGDGYVITPITPGWDSATAVAVQSSGRIIVGGIADGIHENSTAGNIGLAGYTSNGELDSTFGINGIMNLGTATGERALDMVLLDDDRILVAGFVDSPTISQALLLARYTANGFFDGSFGANGMVILDLIPFDEHAEAIAVQPDGKILLGGFLNAGPSDGTRDIVLARFDSQGNPDPAFGDSGVVIQDLGGDLLPGNEEIYDLALQNDGKIIAAGTSDLLENKNHFLLARFQSDGTLDATFQNGAVFTEFGPDGDAASAVFLTSNSILAVGYMVIPGSGLDLAMARYLLGAEPPPPGDCNGALYCDLFDDGVLSPDWSYLKPSWNETGGSLTGTPSGKKAIAIAPTGWSQSNVYTIQTTMKASVGEFSSVWLLGWYQDKKNTIELQMKEGNDKWILKHRVNGVIVAKAKGLKTILPDTFYSVKVSFDGSQFQVFVDDATTPLITLQATHPVSAGTIGYQVKNTTASFDYIRVD